MSLSLASSNSVEGEIEETPVSFIDELSTCAVEKHVCLPHCICAPFKVNLLSICMANGVCHVGMHTQSRTHRSTLTNRLYYAIPHKTKPKTNKKRTRNICWEKILYIYARTRAHTNTLTLYMNKMEWNAVAFYFWMQFFGFVRDRKFCEYAYRKLVGFKRFEFGLQVRFVLFFFLV